ncbi:putative F-box/kelch-repeat protein [Cocos nucifera]|uniref:Putative F-box/kelch-repeat protein n=1 Tax=Cocos nucifera TaxID=13894 RepID=A0A8K0N5A7_COCNU|nr:putative F-box/kelch-repeat protein [Cocos nucifera]
MSGPLATKNHATLLLLYRLTLLDASTTAWAPLLPIPGIHHGLPPFCRLITTIGTELVVVGRWDPCTWVTSDEVFIYDLVSKMRHYRARMLGL